MSQKKLIFVSHFFLFVASVYPFLVLELFPFTDYFNHLARYYIIHNAGEADALGAIYFLKWQISPYLVLDMIMDNLQSYTSLYIAGKVSIILALGAVVVGVLMLARQIHGYVGWSTLFVYPFLFNFALAFGFVNFIFGLGVSYISLALWLRYREVSGAYVILGFLFLFNFFVHAISFGLLVLTILLLEFFRIRKTFFADYHRLVVVFLLLIPEVVLWSFVPGDVAGLGTRYGSIGEKISTLSSPFFFSSSYLDYAFYISFLFILATRSLSIHSKVFATIIALVLLAPLVPIRLFGIFLTDIRLPIFIVFLLICSSKFVSYTITTDRVFLSTLCLVFIVVSVFRHMDNVQRLNSCDSSINEFRHALKTTNLQSGAPILPVRNPMFHVPGCAFPYGLNHLSNLTIIEKQLFSPDLFTVLPPIQVHEKYQSMDVFAAPAITAKYFLNPNFDRTDFSYLKHWESDFKYVLWPYPNKEVLRSYPFLEPIHAGSYFTILENSRYQN